jgi:ribosomal protein S18 acetylase RimI-like enzyme
MDDKAGLPGVFHDPFSGVMIRLVRIEDLQALEWEGEYTHFRRTYQEAFQRMQSGMTIMWVLDLPKTGIIGQAFIQLQCGRPELADGVERAYMYAFRVRPEYRSLGLGSMLLQYIENYLILRQFSILTLNVAKDNPRAQQLYLKHGYRVVAHEPGEWSYQDEKGIIHHVHEPAWRMEKKLVL